MILRQRAAFEVGRSLMLVDVAIVAAAAVLYGPRVGLYCVLGLFGKTLVVDGAIERLHLRKVCTVICSCSLDDHAFMTVVNSSEIIGKGFRGLNEPLRAEDGAKCMDQELTG